ncbi:hypothetical protein roselon_02652 [Roseibacterium elongatum DSM 19469]|uniref:Uncharacterized protein n=1 Tax=Roseicyclus elongatus DSM 19469 TaxID=1294273 RepID=W8S462_9RHOB|nr:hypothetical protein roselon_02652 [Roseibacterium elongatum DSM 19469]
MRVLLGVSYLIVAALEMVAPGALAPASGDPFLRSPDLELKSAIALLILAVAASWLVLGIRTRVMALLSVALLLGFAWSNHYIQTGGVWAIYAASAVILSGPLLRFGGGRHALVKGAWQGLA